MPEEHETPSEPKITQGMTKAEVQEALANHRREMEDHFKDQRDSLTDEIKGLSAGDKAEREELKQQLKDLREWQDEQIKTQEAKDKVKGDQHTIVVPPETLAPPVAPTPEPTATGPQQHSEIDKPRGLKRFW